MSQIPEIKKLVLEDVPAEHRGWFGKVVESLNRFMSGTVSTLNGHTELVTNIQAQVKQVEFQYASAAFSFPLQFQCTLPVRPTLVIKGRFEDISSIPVAITTAIDIDWSFGTGGEVIINNITGLTPLHKYRITLLVF